MLRAIPSEQTICSEFVEILFFLVLFSKKKQGGISSGLRQAIAVCSNAFGLEY